MNKVLLSLAIWMVSLVAVAQKPHNHIHQLQTGFGGNLVAEKFCESSFNTFQLDKTGSLQESIINYLKSRKTYLADDQSGLSLNYTKSSPGGQHFAFDQWFAGAPVFNSETKVNIDKQRRIRSVFDNTYNSTLWDGNSLENDLTQIDLEYLQQTFKEVNKLPFSEIEARKVIALIDNEAIALTEMKVLNQPTDMYSLFLVDNDGDILHVQDLNVYARDTATGLVFNPDPLTSAGSTYKAPYLDNSDADNAQLNGQRVQVSFEVERTGNLYELQSNYFEIAEFSSPAIAPVTSNNGTFVYDRSQAGFEDVNAFYHLNHYHNYLASIGYDVLVDFFTRVDVHALSGGDNSLFSPSAGTSSLSFGEGGVDDAEDADVIVHEYGHAISHSASPFGNQGSERAALDEGVGDYFAASYSRSINSFLWENVFSWDGHNEYWNGRTAKSGLCYPDELTGSIHANGQIWSSALMEIQLRTSRVTADQLALETLYSFARNISFADAAAAYLQADSMLNNGTNICTIAEVFWSFGLIDSNFATSCGPFASRCKSIVSNGPDLQANESAITVLNTAAFANGLNELLIVTPISASNKKLELLDISGKLLYQETDFGANYQPTFPANLAKGAYLLRITTNESSFIKKLVKVN